jgi:sn-glycerol 3-phosphate transport system substrate-binding protein
MILFYNKDAFAEVGLDPETPPANWAELAEFAQKLTKRDAAGNVERYGVGIALNSGSAQWGFTGFALQNSENGENLMTEDGKHVLFYTPGNIEALQFWYDLQNVYQVMQPGIVQWTDLPGQFIDGSVAMIYHTTGNLNNINTNADFAFGTAFLPAGRRFGAPTGGGNFYISANIAPERQQAAWEFIKFATSTDWAARWSVGTGFVATRYSSYETDLMKEFYERLPQAMIARDQLAIAGPELTTYDAPRIWRILNDNIQSAIMGDMTPAEALANAQAEADEVLSRFR